MRSPKLKGSFQIGNTTEMGNQKTHLRRKCSPKGWGLESGGTEPEAVG